MPAENAQMAHPGTVASSLGVSLRGFPRTVALDAVLWPTGQGGCLLGVWNGSAAALDRSQLMLDE